MSLVSCSSVTNGTMRYDIYGETMKQNNINWGMTPEKVEDITSSIGELTPDDTWSIGPYC